jgi:transposase
MMMEVAGEEIETLAMDHHGLVAAMCKELRIAKRIDDKLFDHDQRRVISPGQAVVAMILNGLGFTNRRLYLTQQFFEGKPVERLLGANIQASDLTDHTLGQALDEIASYGTSKLFGEVAFGIAIENNLLGNVNHLDTTSVSVEGEYDVEDNLSKIEIRHGYSKDHRPDLKQIVLSLVVNGAGDIPLWMEPLSGNSSDKKSFHETIKKVRDFQKEINLEKNFKWVADSALYSKEHLLKSNDYLWLTRVPETISEAQELVSRPSQDIAWQERDKGYKTAAFKSNYGEVEQRWLLVYSAQAYQREKITLEKRLEKQEAVLRKTLWHLGNEQFNCESDALKALKPLKKKNSLFQFNDVVQPVVGYGRPGKPKAGEVKMIVGYQIMTDLKKDAQKIELLLEKKGRFILATNDLDAESYSDQHLLEEYKSQQSVECGFRFLKDPWFMLDSIFLKLPHRVEALMMVMTLCLLVYNVAQYKLRSALAQQDMTLPNQLGKEVKNPTMRWIFQIMEGIGIVRFYEGAVKRLTKEVITNLTGLRKKVIALLGAMASEMYGLIPKSQSEVLGT